MDNEIIKRQRLYRQVFEHPETMRLITLCNNYTLKENKESGFQVRSGISGSRFEVMHSEISYGDEHSVKLNGGFPEQKAHLNPTLEVHAHPKSERIDEVREGVHSGKLNPVNAIFQMARYRNAISLGEDISPADIQHLFDSYNSIRDLIDFARNNYEVSLKRTSKELKGYSLAKRLIYLGTSSNVPSILVPVGIRIDPFDFDGIAALCFYQLSNPENTVNDLEIDSDNLEKNIKGVRITPGLPLTIAFDTIDSQYDDLNEILPLISKPGFN